MAQTHSLCYKEAAQTHSLCYKNYRLLVALEFGVEVFAVLLDSTGGVFDWHITLLAQKSDSWFQAGDVCYDTYWVRIRFFSIMHLF